MTVEISLERTTFYAPKVLVVDDELAFRKLLTRQLEGLGCEVQSFPNASDFLGNLSMAKKAFDLVVVDIHLPDLSGDKIITWVRESELFELKTMPVLIVTGGPLDLPDSLLNDHAISVLLKPYAYSNLKVTVARMLNRMTLH